MEAVEHVWSADASGDCLFDEQEGVVVVDGREGDCFEGLVVVSVDGIGEQEED